MKPAQIFHQYIWLINTLKVHRALTLDELDRKWRMDGVTDGNQLTRSTLTRHRRSIFDMFGIIIEADSSTYKYSIRNADVLANGSIAHWLYNTLSVHGVLAESVGLKERVVLENIPSGAEYLSTIIHAFHTGRRLRMGYQKFNGEGYVKTVCPYALKLFHQRWYLLALNDELQLRIYALDRISELSTTEDLFEMPDDFSPQDYFSEYFGVLTTDTPMAHVVIRAYGYTPNYLRTLPLHHSQREVATAESYADFTFDIRPTHDFMSQLLSHGAGIEVLSPPDVREQMRQKFAEGIKRY